MKDKFYQVGAWALARSQEPTTWAGVAVVVAALTGHALGDTMVQAIAIVGTAVGAALIAATEKHGPGAALTTDHEVR